MLMFHTITTTSLTLRKKLKHALVPNSTNNHINMNSHSNMIRNINRVYIVNQQQKVQQQTDQQQSLHTRTSIYNNGERIANYKHLEHGTLKVDVKTKIIEVRIKAKYKLTRKLTVKDNSTTLLSMSVAHLKVPDSFSKFGSLYIKDNQCKNIEYSASSSNKIQPSIYNQRRVINHPLEVNDTIGPCRLNISNEQTSCPSKMIVPTDFDLQKDKHHSHTNKHIAPTGKKKAVQQKIGQHIMISNSNTTISLTLQKKMKNDMLLNSNINHINANSHINMIMNINKKSIVDQQQQIDQ